MKTAVTLITLLLAGLAHTAQAGCVEKRSRDPSFIELTVPEGAIRPAGVQDFAFVNDETTVDEVFAKAGPPDASQGTRLTYFIWCFADGTELTLQTRDRSGIEWLRHDGKMIYKRGKKPKS
jgi:hypothetical protein